MLTARVAFASLNSKFPTTGVENVKLDQGLAIGPIEDLCPFPLVASEYTFFGQYLQNCSSMHVLYCYGMIRMD